MTEVKTLSLDCSISSVVEINLPMLGCARNVTEWRTENFFWIELLTLKKHKARRSLERRARCKNVDFVARA
jgi:hypothetical protein